MSAQEPPAVGLRDVSKSFTSRGKRIRALDDFSIDVREQEFLTIVGPSGCGKSTVLNMIAGLIQPDAGQVLFRGEARPRRGDLDIGYVTQSDSLFPWRTVRGNVEYPLEIRGVPANERRRAADAYLERVGLAGFEDHLPYQLSGGMRQRGNIVRALVYQPEVVLMDEPFGALDAQTRVVLQQELLRLWDQEHKTIVFITHDLQEAITLGDRVVVMTARPGRVKDVQQIDIPRPRDLARIHDNRRFREILSELWDAVSEEVTAARPGQEAAAR
jgi:NitT/TauT family transport system ATP-binding protein